MSGSPVASPVGLSIASAIAGARVGGAIAFDPASLFASGEKGAYFDAATIATLLQDAAGTTPVTAVGQPIGLLLDQSQGTVDLTGNLGPELVTNGGFDADSDWSKGTGWSISGGVASRNTGTGWETFQQNGILTANAWNIMSFEITEYTSGVLQLNCGNSSAIKNVPQAIDIYSYIIQAVSETNIWFRGKGDAGSFIGSIDNVSVKNILGNHASQSTSTARPVLAELSGARYVNFDGVDDDFDVTMPDLGSNATIALIAADGTVSYQEAQTISGAITLSTDFQKLLYIDRALTAAEKAGWESLA